MGSWPADPRPRPRAAPPVRVAEHGFARPDMDSSEGRRREPKPAWSAECAVRFRPPGRADGRVGRRRRIGPPRKRKKGMGHAGGKEESFLHSRAATDQPLLLFASHSSHEDRSLIRGLNKRTCMTPHTSHNSQVLHISVRRTQHSLHSLRDYDDDDDPLPMLLRHHFGHLCYY